MKNLYLIGFTLIVFGFLYSIKDYTPVNALSIGIGFILILVSYGK